MPDLLIYDEIVSPAERKLWGVGVDAEGFAASLKAAGDGDLTVRINSPGGSLWDGLAIYNQLNAERAKGRKVTCCIDGVALSAASVVAMAGSEVRAAQASEFMLHDPWNFAMGNADDMRKAAERLEVGKAAALSAYRQKTGHSDETLSALMTAETWLTPERAKDLRFVDVVEAPPTRATAQASAAPWRTRLLRHPAARAAYERMQARTASMPPPAAPAKGPDMITPPIPEAPAVELVPKSDLAAVQADLATTRAQLAAAQPVLAAVKALTGKDSPTDQIVELAALQGRVAALPTVEQQRATERASLVSQMVARQVQPMAIQALEAACDAAGGDLAVLRAGAAKLAAPRVFVPAGEERVSDPPGAEISMTDTEYAIYQAAGAQSREEALALKREGEALAAAKKGGR